MTTLLLISVLITVLYVGTTIYIHKELPASVSHMVFNLPRNYQFLWTLFIWSVAFGTVPALLDAMEGSIFQFVGFLFIASLAFIGAMPLIRNNPNTAHSVLAIVAGVLSQLCVLIISPYWLLLWFSLIYFLFAPLPKWLNGKGIFVLEVYCYTTLIAAILCH
jgi:hypothetical protein